MYHSLYQFSKAYQAELVRSVAGSAFRHKSPIIPPSLWRHSLYRMGDIFISLGERMKGQSNRGVEFSKSRT